MGKMGSSVDYVNKIIQGDCVTELEKIPDESISLVVTSPPYGSIRSCYNSTVDYVALRNVLYRKMNTGGVIVWNEQDGTEEGKKTLDSFKHLLMFCEEGFFNCFEHCIYHKHGRPGPWWNRRFRVDHEYLFMMVKGDKPSFFDKAHMAHKINPYINKGTTRKSDGTFAETSGQETSEKSQGTVFFYNPSNLETFAFKEQKLQHSATMPEQMPMDFIRCFTKEGDLVIDPFAGSGTTLRAAKRLNRKYLGFEISEEYCILSQKLLKTIKPRL
jgi:DNA modification methylase